MLEAYIDGNKYQESGILIKKSFLLMSHYFEISYPLYNNVPFHIGSLVEIKIDNIRILKGEIEKIYIQDNLIKIKGESSIASKLNSYPSQPININSVLTLDEIIYQCIGIRPIVKTITEPFQKEEIIIDDNCETYSEYISRLASKRSVYVIEDNNGNLIITRNEENEIIGSLGNLTNISESSFCFDANILYEYIILYTQSNLNSYVQDGTEIPLDKIEGIKIIATDPIIKNGRTLYKNLGYGISEPNLKNLANFQVGIQRASAMKYKIKYPFFLLDNQQPVNIGKLIKVNNEYDNIKGTFFVEEILMVSGAIDGKDGENYSILTLTYMNAYKLNFELGDNKNLGGFINV